MIKSFRCRHTEKLFAGESARRFPGIERQAFRRLKLLDAVDTLQALAALPGNALEALKGDRKGQYSVRINKQWRICFEWDGEGASNVEIVDYH